MIAFILLIIVHFQWRSLTLLFIIIYFNTQSRWTEPRDRLDGLSISLNVDGWTSGGSLFVEARLGWSDINFVSLSLVWQRIFITLYRTDGFRFAQYPVKELNSFSIIPFDSDGSVGYIQRKFAKGCELVGLAARACFGHNFDYDLRHQDPRTKASSVDKLWSTCVNPLRVLWICSHFIKLDKPHWVSRRWWGAVLSVYCLNQAPKPGEMANENMVNDTSRNNTLETSFEIRNMDWILKHKKAFGNKIWMYDKLETDMFPNWNFVSSTQNMFPR